MQSRLPRALILASCFMAACLSKAAAADTSEVNCLHLVWESQSSPNKAFDRKYDGSGDNAISCATLTSATAFETILQRIRTAARRGDRSQLLRLSHFPLIYIDPHGRRTNLSRRQAVDQAKYIFPSKLLASLQRVNLRRMEVVRNKGAFFDQGTLWLSVSKVGGTPGIITINLEALEEDQHRTKAASGR